MYLNGSNKKAAACFIANSLNIFKPGPRSGIQKIKNKVFYHYLFFIFFPDPRSGTQTCIRVFAAMSVSY